MNLNGPQQEAVAHMEGPCLVLAGPGSGKTAVLTQRIYKLIENNVPANEILVITFTKAAAMEMKERFDKLVGKPLPVTFGTFHSLFWSVLRTEYNITSENILMGEMKKQLLIQACQKSNVKYDDEDFLNSLLSEIGFINNALIEVDEYESKEHDNAEIRQIYRDYQEIKRRYKRFDFDDMLSETYQLFLSRKDILAKWQKKYSYFLVDEMQDMNMLQYRLIQMLSARTKNLFCVGDDDQSIYDFRGANPQIMLDFPKDYPDCRNIVLNQNYRCPRNIINHAVSLIEKNETRFSKEIHANKPDSQIEFIEADSLLNEAVLVSEKILSIAGDEASYGDCAVLFRNHRNVKYIIEDLIKRNIPFYIKDSMPNIYTNHIINDIMTYFYIAMGKVTRGRMLMILNKPNRYLFRQCVENGYTFDSMRKYYIGNSNIISNINSLESDMNLISKMSATAAVNYIRKAIGYDRYLQELSIKSNQNLEEFYEILEFLEVTLRDCKTIRKAIEKIEFLKEKMDFENKNKQVDPSNKVGLYTLHSSKGLEFENVFIVGANEGVIPSKRAKKNSEIESERRLFYVGVTRTKNRLYISYLNEKNRDRCYPSRFLSEFYKDYSSPKASS